MDQLCLELDVRAPQKQALKLSAADEVRRILSDVLPADVPPFFARIVSARRDGKRQIVAELEMFDGLRAEIEVWQWNPQAWAHRWTRFEGSDISWEDGRWTRVTHNAAA